MFGRRRDRQPAHPLHSAHPAATRADGKAAARRGRRLPGEQAAPSYTPSIALRSIDGHLTRTGQEVYAWYKLAPQRWSFRSDSQRQDLIQAIAGQYAELQGRWMHLRVTTRPYPIRMWAEAHVRNALNRLPDVPGSMSFDDYMIGEQQQLLGRSMAEKEVYLGVQVQTRNVMDRAVERAAPLLRRVFPAAVDAELVALDAEVEHLDIVMGGAGLEGRPVSADEMAWLMHRSCSLGLPAPRNLPGNNGAVPGAIWEPEDLASFTDAADFHQEPYSPTVTVHGRTGSNAGTRRHLVVLTVGLMHGLQIPEVDDPWVQRADRLPAPVEWSARIYVRRPEEVGGELQRQMNKVRSQVRHYTDEHELEPPQSLSRQAARVLEIDDEMTSGFTALATRVRSWWRLAVSGTDEREALKLAQQLLDLYKPKIAIEHPESQYALAREFIPGEPLSSGAYLRRGSVVWAASSVPTATAEVGDRRGVLLGETCTTTRRPVAWDPWMAQEVRDGSGLTAMVAGLGGGKSFLGGGLVYKTLRAGAHWTLLDPSGPLAQLCSLPELRPYARPINLLNAQPGILNPYRVVPEPLLEHFLDEDDPERSWRREKALVAATRRRLVLDVLTGLLPYEVARLPQSRIVLLRAVRAVGGRPDAHPGQVFEALRRDASEHHEHAVVVADFLDEMRDRMSLLIPEEDDDPYSRMRDDRLTVLTMAGLTLPKDGVGREHWTDAESLGVELLNLAAWLTQRSIYERPKDLRKGVWIDEAFFLSEVPTGRVLMNRFARDSRKWNVRVLLSSQIPADFLKIQGFVTLLDSVFVGRLDDENAQADALRLLKVPVGAGYEQVIAALGRRPGGHRGTERDRAPRQFVFGDGAGGVERIRADFSGQHLAHLVQALDTTPDAQRDVVVQHKAAVQREAAAELDAATQREAAAKHDADARRKAAAERQASGQRETAARWEIVQREAARRSAAQHGMPLPRHVADDPGATSAAPSGSGNGSRGGGNGQVPSQYRTDRSPDRPSDDFGDTGVGDHPGDGPGDRGTDRLAGHAATQRARVRHGQHRAPEPMPEPRSERSETTQAGASGVSAASGTSGGSGVDEFESSFSEFELEFPELDPEAYLERRAHPPEPRHDAGPGDPGHDPAFEDAVFDDAAFDDAEQTQRVRIDDPSGVDHGEIVDATVVEEDSTEQHSTDEGQRDGQRDGAKDGRKDDAA